MKLTQGNHSEHTFGCQCSSFGSYLSANLKDGEGVGCMASLLKLCSHNGFLVCWMYTTGKSSRICTKGKDPTYATVCNDIIFFTFLGDA